jgi:hypothetical protein
MGWVLMSEREVHHVEVLSCVVAGRISESEAASSLLKHAAFPPQGCRRDRPIAAFRRVARRSRKRPFGSQAD